MYSIQQAQKMDNMAPLAHEGRNREGFWMQRKSMLNFKGKAN